MRDEQPMSGNELPPGISLEQVEGALLHSGYPLQTAVSELLRSEFDVLPEWGYRDRTTDTLRTLDMLALHSLSDLTSDDSRVRPALALLIECKRSELPYVFFTERDLSGSHGYEVPKISGLHKDHVRIKTDDDGSTWSLRPLHVLGLGSSPFVREVSSCSIFSKCVRKGAGLELSGTEAYSGIMMPLMSALDFFSKASAPRSTFYYLDAFLVLPVAIVDAPMLAYDAKASEGGVKFTSWQRVLRNEPAEEDTVWGHLGSLSAVDVVHRSYFETYLKEHVMPFARTFSERALRHHEELASGKAFAPGFGKDSWTDIEQRVRPSGKKGRVERQAAEKHSSGED